MLMEHGFNINMLKSFYILAGEDADWLLNVGNN